MHATLQDPDSDPDTEDIVVYADEKSKERRVAQDQQRGQNMRLYPVRNYVHLQQQLQSTRSGIMTEGWSARSRSDEVLGGNAKMNLQQQFERSVVAEECSSTPQRLLRRGRTTSSDDQSRGDLPIAQQQLPTAAVPPHCKEDHRFGVCLAQHGSPPEQRLLAGSQQRQKPPATARKGAVKASFAIREPQPAGLSLKASLQQLRGTTNCSQANRDREKSADDVIISNAGEEQQPQYKFLPSASQAAVQTPTQAPGELREPSRAAGGISAQRNFLASVLKPGKRQNPGFPHQVPKRTGRAAGMNGPLTGRFYSILQEEEQLPARGNGDQFLEVQVTEREQQGSIVTCRCSVVSSGITAQSVIALFRSTIALETHVGSRLTICSPWRECTVPGIDARIVFVLAAYSSTNS